MLLAYRRLWSLGALMALAKARRNGYGHVRCSGGSRQRRCVLTANSDLTLYMYLTLRAEQSSQMPLRMTAAWMDTLIDAAP